MNGACVAVLLLQDVLKVKDLPEPALEQPAADDLAAAGEIFFSKPQQLLQVRQTSRHGGPPMRGLRACTECLECLLRLHAWLWRCVQVYSDLEESNLFLIQV